jgi:crotonobetainyl-CoA:carnitine CoA-transferase CaiB-like acyl-CoA transferase
MSGFAAMTGEPGGPPTLPPFGLADGISALAISQAIMFALFAQKNELSESFNKGQVIDLAIIEPILAILGPHATVYDQLKIIQPRTGNRSVNNSPRNTYLTKDGKWLAVSTSAQSIAERVLTLVGHSEVIAEPWFASGSTRAEHSELLDLYVSDWIKDRDASEVIKAFEEAEAAVAPIYDIRDILTDPQFIALKTILEVQDPALGQIKMQNVLYRMSGTPGQIKWTGRAPGANSRQILEIDLKLTKAQIDKLIKIGVVGVNE